MQIEIVQLGTETRIDLSAGRYSLGGQATDDIRVPGLPKRWMDLHVSDTYLTVTGRAALLLEDSLVSAETPRRMQPGDCIRLGEGIALRLAGYLPPAANGTAAMLKELLGEALVPSPGCAAVLTCLTGLDAGVRFALSDEPSEIGRGENAQIRIRDRAVSRRHARMTRRGDRFIIEDLGTPNGIYVNGHRLASPFELSDDAVIELGRSVLRFRTPQESIPPPETPPAAPATASQPVGSSGPDAEQHSLSLPTSEPGRLDEHVEHGPPPLDGPSPPRPAPPASPDSTADAGAPFAEPIHSRTEWALILTGAMLALSSGCVLLVVA